jgi:hypothetical protein
MAVKDSKILDHWVDYNHEAHLTRRLIDRGCRNVINVRIFEAPTLNLKRRKAPDNYDR